MRTQITDEDEMKAFYVSGDYFTQDGDVKFDTRRYDAMGESGAVKMAESDGLVRFVEAFLGEQ